MAGEGWDSPPLQEIEDWRFVGAPVHHARQKSVSGPSKASKSMDHPKGDPKVPRGGSMVDPQVPSTSGGVVPSKRVNSAPNEQALAAV